jgi:hypothetical protein
MTHIHRYIFNSLLFFLGWIIVNKFLMEMTILQFLFVQVLYILSDFFFIFVSISMVKKHEVKSDENE